MPNDLLATLKKKRASARRSLTAYSRFLELYNPNEDFLSLEKKSAEIDRIRENFLKYQEEIEILEEDSDELFQYKTDFEDDYFKAYTKGTNFLRAHQSQSIQPTAINTPSDHNNSNLLHIQEKPPPQLQNSYGPQFSGLPAIELPKFGGVFDEWLNFHDLFESFIHGDETIPPIRKLYYLKGCLVGEAANVISTIEASAANYEIAWNLLKDRYDNRKVIRENYIQALLDAPSVSKEFSTQSFVDLLQKNLRALKNLEEPVDDWSSLLIIIFRAKLSNPLRDRWEEQSSRLDRPTINKFIEFLTQRAQFEATRASAVRLKIEGHSPNNKVLARSKQAFTMAISTNQCIHCLGNDHTITACNGFITLDPQSRYETAKKKGLCINCLRGNHHVSKCNAGKCRKCGSKHHTLLHFERSNEGSTGTHKGDNNSTDSAKNEIVLKGPEHSSRINLHAVISSEALLATAVVDIVNSQGMSKACRVFLDAGSQAHFITEATANFLNLNRINVNIAVNGVDDLCTNVKHAVHATLKSRFSKFTKNVEFLIVPQISRAMPSAPINISNLDLPKNIRLADPNFCKPSAVDALIGVKLFYKLLSVGQIKLKNHPDAFLQKTQLGWVIAGSLNHSFKPSALSCHITISNTSDDINLTRFWELEEVCDSKPFSAEEQACEDHYCLNTVRDSNGRYMVRLPFNNNVHKLGRSHTTALRRFLSLEKRLTQNQETRDSYVDFLQEYSKLGHMSIISVTDMKTPGFYLPHHAVIKKDSLTTKTRVVFDGSAKSSTGLSLNDALMIGPKVQDNLFNILVRYRCHLIALTADIEKMYRQILVHPDDANYQRILFRTDPSQPLDTFILKTVTYGTASASYLAIRTLHQLADDEGSAFPLAAVALKLDFYVDDLLTGANTHSQAEKLCDELRHIMKKGGFTLRKWASNDPTLLHECDEHPNTNHMSLDPNATIKTLGIQWNAREDNIFYSVNIDKTISITKRSILAQIAKLFDPLGLLGPIILHAKIIMQSLWKAGVSWDESIPNELHTSWRIYLEQLPIISNLRFPRCITTADARSIQLHGFCDASEKAYGACIYLRTLKQNGDSKVILICSKSRVAPVSAVSLPRLELCGALLLSRLLEIVKQSLSIAIDDYFLWSDSTVTLHWINTSPHRLKTFVANRVAEIQRLTATYHWRHIATRDNPADLVSRGQLPAEFLVGSLWQHGSGWLSKPESFWPNAILSDVCIPELKPDNISIACLALQLRGTELIERYSSMIKVTRIVAYLFRFINNSKCKGFQRIYDGLTSVELATAREAIIRLVQSSAFSGEVNSLRNGTPISSTSSRLVPLSPFLDSKGILRVGGRLARSDLPDNQRHPILLPANHHITRTIVREEHIRLKHAGTQATLYSVRQAYWPLDGRNNTRKLIHQCVTCFRAKPRRADHVMGDLPFYRVSPSRPFLRSGVDYCGPIYIKEKKHRNRLTLKVYVAIYVCMSTKAVHLEVVSDLTTEAFIASLRRFFSRRGKSTDIFSDNATNFIGANREIRELYELIASTGYKNSIQAYMQAERINWHFIPPKSPHFGGLWEAAVKSFKHHLTRSVGKTLLTYEQLETYVIEVEAILNSRPISPLSSDPNDLLPLTPGHFLVGNPLTSLPQFDWTNTMSNRLSAWQHAQQMRQHFWKRWCKEYLHQLISRPLGHGTTNNLDIGAMVILVEDNLPPLQWSTGRIIAVHPGQDGVVRAATVKTTTGEYKRCIRKLCPLPIDNSLITCL